MQRYLTRQLQTGVAGLQGGQADLQHKLQSLQDANHSLQESQASLLGRVAVLEAALDAGRAREAEQQQQLAATLANLPDREQVELVGLRSV